MKKICFFTTHFDFTRQRMLTDYEKILPKDIGIFLFCQNKEKNKFKTKRAKKIGYFTKKILVGIELRNFSQKNKIDIVTNLSGSTRIALTLIIATIFNKTKNIYYNHGNPPFKNITPLFFFQFFLNRILFCSQDITEKIRKYLFLSKNKIFYLPPIIDTDFFKPKIKKQLRKKLKINQNEKVIIFVGRIHYSKGSDFLLKIIKRNPNKKFLLIGRLMDKNYKINELNNIIHISEANAKELVNYYSISDLSLLLSRREGYGLVPREAMACGIPTIVSNIESLRMIKKAIKTPLDINKTQKIMDWFFNLSEKEKNQLSKKSRKSIINEYSKKVLKEKHLKYFLNI